MQRFGSQFFSELMATADELLWLEAILRPVEGVEEGPMVGELGPETIDHEALQIAGRDAPAG